MAAANGHAARSCPLVSLCCIGRIVTTCSNHLSYRDCAVHVGLPARAKQRRGQFRHISPASDARFLWGGGEEDELEATAWHIEVDAEAARVRTSSRSRSRSRSLSPPHPEEHQFEQQVDAVGDDCQSEEEEPWGFSFFKWKQLFNSSNTLERGRQCLSDCELDHTSDARFLWGGTEDD